MNGPEGSIGRLLTDAERRRSSSSEVRSAFVIVGGEILTAWHCVKRIGGVSAQIWLRIRRPGEGAGLVDVPVALVDHSVRFDAAILTLDPNRFVETFTGMDLQELRDHLVSIGLPLGTHVKDDDRLRIGGFPQTNQMPDAQVFRAKVTSTTAPAGGVRAIRTHVLEFAAFDAESPRGMSGGPLLRRGSDGVERVVGIVHGSPASDAAGAGKGSLGGALHGRHIEDVVAAIPAVARALARSSAEPVEVRDTDGDGVQLSTAVVESYWLPIAGAGFDPPAVWGAQQLRNLRYAIQVSGQVQSRVADQVQVLYEAVQAKVVFVALGGGSLPLDRIRAIYQLEVGIWADGNTADALLVQAADIQLSERRRDCADTLGSLVRFMTAVASALGTPPDANKAFARWIDDIGVQPADVTRHFERQLDAAGWLLIDFGDEPVRDDRTWPERISWTLTSNLPGVGDSVTCEPSQEGLAEALRHVLTKVAHRAPRTVDLAMPYGLLNQGIEHWAIRELDGRLTSLSAGCRPRLRWSRRRRSSELQRYVVDRMRSAAWSSGPTPLHGGDLSDAATLRRLIHPNKRQPWLVGGCTASPDFDPLRLLLVEGCGFIVWSPAGIDEVRHRAVVAATDDLRISERRANIPDALPEYDDWVPVVIWDDPNGRDGFPLPPLVAAEGF